MQVSPNVSRISSALSSYLFRLRIRETFRQSHRSSDSTSRSVHRFIHSNWAHIHNIVSACHHTVFLEQHTNLETRLTRVLESVFQMTQLLTLEQVAKKLSVSKRTVQRLIKAGQIETLHPSSGLVSVRDTALERFIDNLQRKQRLSGVNKNV